MVRNKSLNKFKSTADLQIDMKGGGAPMDKFTQNEFTANLNRLQDRIHNLEKEFLQK